MATTRPAAAPPGFFRGWLTPSLADVFFVALFLAVFARSAGLQSLLGDGDTGWHIRAGELVLQTGRVPVADPFSFSRPGQPWFAWEWGADALFALCYRWRGLGGVAAMAGVVLALAAAVVFARMLRREVGLWIALAFSLAAASASSIHYLARPHVFSILLYAVALAVIEEDVRHPGWRVWTLVPLAALWANLHAGFAMLPATLALAALCGRSGTRPRYALLAAASGAATLLNPYGWRLHEHIFGYLNSSWILDHVREFQSPSIRAEGAVVFALLLLGAVAVAGRAGRLEAALVLVWGFAALRSARHVPFFAMVGAPVAASACAAWWRRHSESAHPQSPGRILWDLSQDLGRRWRFSAWCPAAAAALLFVTAGAGAGFPESRFPVVAVERNARFLAPPAEMPRVLTSDQWADYLIFRLYPRQRVFVDGRSDFYGASLGQEYGTLMAAESGWRELLGRYGFSLALLPNDWALSTVLDREPGWRLVYRDPVAVLYARCGADPPVRAGRPRPALRSQKQVLGTGGKPAREVRPASRPDARQREENAALAAGSVWFGGGSRCVSIGGF
jgi:hypothetical protein